MWKVCVLHYSWLIDDPLNIIGKYFEIKTMLSTNELTYRVTEIHTSMVKILNFEYLSMKCTRR